MDAVTEDNAKLVAALESAEKLSAFRDEQKQLMKSDLAGMVKDRQVIEQHLKAVNQQLGECPQADQRVSVDQYCVGRRVGSAGSGPQANDRCGRPRAGNRDRPLAAVVSRRRAGCISFCADVCGIRIALQGTYVPPLA